MLQKTFLVILDYPHMDRAMVLALQRASMELGLASRTHNYSNAHIKLLEVSADITPVGTNICYKFEVTLKEPDSHEEEEP